MLRKEGKEENVKKIEIKEDANGLIYVKVSYYVNQANAFDGVYSTLSSELAF